MSDIVFDLEWNQAALKAEEDSGIPFEIIEIGAVKLDSDGRIADTFSRLIRPVVYPVLFYRVREVVGLTTKQLQSTGGDFREVIEEFIAWCGENPVFYTWGNMDLTELQRNIAYYQLESPFPFPLFYYDVQKLYGLQRLDRGDRIALELAVDREGLLTETAFHRAVYDAEYTARVLQLLDKEQWKSMVSVDYYRPPLCAKEELYLVFDGYAKFVSMPYPSTREAMEARNVSSTVCYKCGNNVVRRIPWFTDNNRNYYSLSLCPRHGWLRGKIRTKHYGQEVFMVKTMKLVDEEGAQKIRLKYQRVKEKRKRNAIRHPE